MPRPAGWTPTTPVDVANLNANTKDVIGDLDLLNPVYFPNSDLVSAINAVPGMMSKTFYVDAVNGNDSNDGSQAAPFATLKKAIDSAPPGAVCYIYLLDNAPHIVSANIYANNKRIVITKAAGVVTNPKVIFKSYTVDVGGTVYNSNNHLSLSNSYIYTSYVDFEVEAATDTTLPYASASRGFHTDNSNALITNSNIIGNGLSVFSSRNTNGAFSLFICSVIINNGNLIDTNYGTMRFASYSTTYVDSTGAILSPPPITGIIKDTNGTPRNVISNIVL